MPHCLGGRRLVPAALALILASVLPLAVQAAPARPSTAAWFAHSAMHQLAPAAFPASRLLDSLRAHGLRPELRSGAPLQQTVTDPTKLAFTPPSNATNVAVGTVDVAFADDNTKNIFTALTNTTYASSGMQSGYAEGFSLPIGTGSDTVDIAYLATIYGTAAQATARVTANQQYLTSKGLTAASCGTSCDVFALQFADNSGRTINVDYVIWSNGNVVAELAFFVPSDVASANNNDFLADIKTVTGLATTAVPVQQAAGTPLTIVSFDLAHTVKKQAKLTHKLKSGEAGVFVADIQFPNAGDTIQAQVTFTIGKKTVGPLILGSPQNVSDTEVVVGASHKFKVKKTTSAVAHLVVQDGSAQATKDLNFKITH